MSLTTLKKQLLSVSGFLGLRPASAAAGDDEVAPALSGSNGGLLVEYPAGATAPLPTGAATEATLASIDGTVDRVARDKAQSRVQHTCHDTTEVTSAGGIAFTVPTTGLHTFKLVNDSTSIEEYLIAGVVYPGELKLMTTASVSATCTIWYL